MHCRKGCYDIADYTSFAQVIIKLSYNKILFKVVLHHLINLAVNDEIKSSAAKYCSLLLCFTDPIIC